MQTIQLNGDWVDLHVGEWGAMIPSDILQQEPTTLF